MMLGYFSLYSLEIEERNRKRRGVSSQSSFIVGSGGCMDMYVRQRQRKRERGGEEGKERVLHSQTKLLPLDYAPYLLNDNIWAHCCFPKLQEPKDGDRVGRKEPSSRCTIGEGDAELQERLFAAFLAPELTFSVLYPSLRCWGLLCSVNWACPSPILSFLGRRTVSLGAFAVGSNGKHSLNWLI